jgi:hypothetical protein
MKKRLEAELISIAHRILKLKNKSEISILLLETRKIYEALLVLQFVEQNQNIIQPPINIIEIESKIEANLNQNNPELISTIDDLAATNDSQQEPILETELPLKEVFNDSKPIIHLLEETEGIDDNENLVVEDDAQSKSILETKPEPIDAVLPINEPEATIVLEKQPEIIFEKNKEPQKQQISFEELLGHQYIQPTFEKKQDKPTTLNDVLGKTINFGLNDRIGFVKNLFDGSDQDFTRVVLQIETFDSFAEVEQFINNLVKPDYKNWENATDYATRFMEIIERKFS